MHILSVSGVAFEFSNGRELFVNLNFSLDAKLTALVGPNGVGKTCLAHLLAGLMEPTRGHIGRHGVVSFFPQRVDPPLLSVADYLADAYSWSVVGEQLLEGIDREKICVHLSGGQWMRVRLARSVDDEFLILDEPTNDLDRQGRETILNFLRCRTQGSLLISHDRECLELSNHGLSNYGMLWTDYVIAKESERAGLSRNLDLAKRERESKRSDRIELMARQEKRNRKGMQIGIGRYF